MISEPYKHVKMIRLVNVPPSVSDEDIRSIASNWGGVVLSIDSERLPHPFEAIKSFVRRIRIRFSSQEDENKVPISIRFSGFTFSIQLEGRQKVCYRCRQVGHIKSECTVKKCQKCYALSHDDPDCQQKKSYITAVTSSLAEAGITPSSPAIQGSDNGEQPTNQLTTNQVLLREQRLPVCRKCKQSGHVKKYCPVQENQLSKHDENNHENVIEEKTKETPTTTVVDVGKENDSPLVNPRETTNIDENEHLTLTAVATSMQHRIMYEAYKNSSSEFKRTCADRSMDSDLEMDPKKLHTHISPTSMTGENENEEGELTEH